MRLRLVLLCLLAFPIVASADSYYLTIAGSVGSFRTDVRIFNPSSSDSNVSLVFVPVGNQNNGAAFLNSVHKVIPKGQGVAYDDAVASIFGATGLGAISIDADTPLIVTSRIYSQTADGTMTIQPYGVIGPTSMTSGLFFNAGNADLSDARVIFQSDVGLGVYGSVVDNITSDPTYFVAMSPSGF